MARVRNINAFISGAEPKYAREINKVELIDCLNWYNENKQSKDAFAYASDFLKKKYKIEFSQSLIDSENSISTTIFGFICRMVSNGIILPKENQNWFDEKIEIIKIQSKKSKSKSIEPISSPTNVISIQDRLAEKISIIAGEFEGLIDEYITNKFRIIPSPYAILQAKGAKGAYANKLIEIWKKHRAEYEEVLAGKDEQLVEAYSRYKKSEIKKLIAFCDLVITDCMKLVEESVKTRKPKKRKIKTPEQIVAKIKHCKEIPELNIRSSEPKDVIGALQLWVYNTKTKSLGCYHAEDAGGLSVKGSSIINYSHSKSTMKRLRKPEKMLPEIMKAGKVFLRNVLDSIKAKESPLTGRINKDVILLRIQR